MIFNLLIEAGAMHPPFYTLMNSTNYRYCKKQMTGWLEQDYCFWSGFERQYKRIKQKILIEPLMRDEINTPVKEIQVYKKRYTSLHNKTA